jgi:putative transposase
MKKRFSEEQIIGVLKEHAAGGNVGGLCRRHGISQTTLYKWKAKFGGMDVCVGRGVGQADDEGAFVKKLVKPDAKRKTVTHLEERHGLSERRACKIAGQERSSQRYEGEKDDASLQEKLLRLARERPRFGSRRLQIFVQREGDFSNIKRVRRVYRALGLCVRRRKGRKRAIGTRLPLPQVDCPNQIGSLDFVFDALSCGRRLRVLGIEDQYAREGLALVVDSSLPGLRVVRELERVCQRRGVYPKCIRATMAPR